MDHLRKLQHAHCNCTVQWLTDPQDDNIDVLPIPFQNHRIVVVQSNP
jgi:hypothetical protein